MSMNKPWILLLWGAPAAGKSTLCECLKSEYQERTGKLLCHLGTDRLNRSLLDDHFDPSVRGSLYRTIATLSSELAAQGRCVLVEGTFLCDEWRRHLLESARSADARLLSVQLECRLNQRLKRNSGRPSHELVPEKFLEECHHRAKLQWSEADFVFDTELTAARGLATFLLNELRVDPAATRGGKATEMLADTFQKAGGWSCRPRPVR